MDTQKVIGIILAFAPIALYIAILLVVKRKLPVGFLSHALREGNEKTTIQENATTTTAADGTTTTAEPTPKPKPSSSRLVLMMSGLMAVTIAACFASYFIYMNVFGMEAKIKLETVGNVLLALGIGVTPYAANQVKQAFSGTSGG